MPLLALAFLLAGCDSGEPPGPGAKTPETPEALETVGKWRRHVVVLEAGQVDGNPFEVELTGHFVHEATGTTLSLHGYYDGAGTWKIGFMPTLVGRWTYSTESPASKLDGAQGSLDAVQAGLPGMLKGDSAFPRKWRYTEGPYVVPMAFRMEFFSEPASDDAFREAAEFLRERVAGHLLETRLMEEYGRFAGRHDFIFEGPWEEHRFDLEVWRRMERRMEVLTEMGLGAHVMFYSDQGGRPPWPARSETEALVIRYAVARLAGYPVVWFNTGIDVSEYRDSGDVTWMGDILRSLDPYGHPVSSREATPLAYMESETFTSKGFPTAARVDAMISAFQDATRPVSFDDAWGENRASHPEKDHSPSDIRRAFWKAVVAGGVGGLVRGGDELAESYNGFFSIGLFADELESEQWLRLIPAFMEDLGSTFGSMVPAPEIVSGVGVYALADPGLSKIVIYSIGEGDRYNSGGSRIELLLGGEEGAWQASWFDPRTGDEISEGQVLGGGARELTTPTPDDWVLVLTGASGSDG